MRGIAGRKSTRSFSLLTYSAPGGLRQDPGHGAQSLPGPEWGQKPRKWGHVTTQGYEEELRSEHSYVTGLYTRLDAERARVKEDYTAALRGPIDLKDGGTLVERDAEVRALAR